MTTTKINLTDDYAYSEAPDTKVRILCLDRDQLSYPVVALSGATVSYHTPTGECNVSLGKNLVPLKVSEKERAYNRWINTAPGWQANLKEAFYAGWEASV